jgi:N-acetylneuraminic acid mutarotase
MTGPLSWQPRPPLTLGRFGLVGARAGGRLLVTGGYPSGSFSDVLHSVERLQPDGSWTESVDPPMPTPRGNAAAASLGGRVYVIGGYSFGPASRSLDVVESYDPHQPLNDWTTVAPLPVAAGLGALGAAGVGGRVYAGGGGGDASVDVENSVWAFDPHPAPGHWTPIAPMNEGRALFKMTALNGKLYAIGGVGTNDRNLASVERYDPDRPGEGWTVVSPMTKPRSANPGVLSAFGRIFVVGGARDEVGASTTEMFDPHAGPSGQWRLLTPLLTPRRASLVALRRGKYMLAIGGAAAPSNAGPPTASTRVDALRIDHPDQLHHPAATTRRRHIG